MDLDCLILCVMGCGWHVAEREGSAMARIRTANGISDLRPQLAGRRASDSLMKLAMDEVSYKHGGIEVHMWKRTTRDQRTALQSNNETVPSHSADSTARGAAVVAVPANAVGSRRGTAC
jgi:hypothetical protein